MKIENFNSLGHVADRCAEIIDEAAKQAIAERGQFTIAFSGGSTPLPLYHTLTKREIDWNKVHVFQVDERIAPAGDENRNFTHLKSCLLDHTPIPSSNVHAMPVTTQPSRNAVEIYENLLVSKTGQPPILDIVHLGIGEDGHTASLIPGDPVLNYQAGYVAITEEYNGYRRMTLSFHAINSARRLLWQITGAHKSSVLKQLINGDQSIPAGSISREQAIVITDIAQ